MKRRGFLLAAGGLAAGGPSFLVPRRARAQAAVSQMRETAKERNLDGMSMSEMGGNYTGGTRPTGGRIARKDGGGVKKGKGKTNINIIIGSPKPEGQGAPPPPSAMPPGPPPGARPGRTRGAPIMPQARPGAGRGCRTPVPPVPCHHSRATNGENGTPCPTSPAP